MKENQKKKALLSRISLNRRLYQYPKALQILEEAGDMFPAAKIEELRNLIQEEHQEYLTKEVPRRWISSVQRKTDNISTRTEIPIAEAQAYVASELSLEVAESVAQSLGIEVAVVQEHFQQAKGRIASNYSYRNNRFVPEISGIEGAEVRDLSKEVTADIWWQKVRNSVRREWLRAYYYVKVLKN
jgi:hypothetical protein